MQDQIYEESEEYKKEVRKLNDLLRDTFITGKVVFTDGIKCLEEPAREALITKIREFKDFNEDNDPHHEHDFGVVQHEDVEAYFKIDYYDKSLQYHSPDASNPKVTTRILTVMLKEEY